MTNFIFQQALPFSLVAGLVGLAAAWGLILWIKGQPDGNDRMREVAAAIQEGAAAYLHRQLQAVSVIALLLFAAICYFKNLPTGIGFLVGAACSLVAGFAGMRIAVMANVRTAPSPPPSVAPPPYATRSMAEPSPAYSLSPSLFYRSEPSIW